MIWGEIMFHTVTKQNIITAFFIFFFGVAIFIWYLNNDLSYYQSVCLGLTQTFIFLGLLLTWGISIHRRIIQTTIRRCLKAICGLSGLWFVIRALKYYIFKNNILVLRYLWYSYYIPLLFIPVFFVLSAVSIGRQDEYQLPKKSKWLFVLAAIFLAIVLTNDFHRLVFVFPNDGTAFSDNHYTYGILYAPIAGWFYVHTMVTLLILIKKCRFPHKKKIFLLPIIPPFLGVVYNIGYILGKTDFFNDFTIVSCFSIILTYETLIRVGLIRANTHYEEIFNCSSISAQIVNSSLQVVYGNPQVFPAEWGAVARLGVIDNNKRILFSSIKGGYVIWQEDISELIRIQSHLESANAYLVGKSTALTEEYETTVKLKRLEHQNHLYNEMQSQMANKLQTLSYLLHQFEQSIPEQEKNYLLPISIITAYLKRRNNLIFLSQENGILPVSELKNCIDETVRNLRIFGMVCDTNIENNKTLTLSQIFSVYDALEDIVETTALYYPSYFISVRFSENQMVLGVRIAGLTSLPNLSLSNLVIEQEDEKEFLLLIPFAREE